MKIIEQFNIAFLNDLFKNAALLDALLLGRINIPNLRLFSNYYSEYYQNKFMDYSFCVYSKGQLLALVICYQIEDKIYFPSEGVKINIFSKNPKELNSLYEQIIDQLEILLAETKSDVLIIKDQFINGKLSPLGERLFNRRYRAETTFEMLINYHGFQESEYLKNIRKSYKSLVNWGKKNLNIEIINQSNLSKEKIFQFKEFHKKISGRQTRSDKTWEIQYEMIMAGFGELILANFQDALVAGSLFIDQNETSTYFTGVYERSLFEYGISHYLLYLGINRSPHRNNTMEFSLGNFDTDIIDNKWYNIQFFKKGFTQELKPILLWSKKSKDSRT